MAESTCLVVFAHGSRDPRWRCYFEKLTADLNAGAGADRVRLAYMEFASPTLQDVATELVASGVRSIRLLPLFIAGGAHVARDIPEQAAAVREVFPDLQVELLPPIGEDQRVIDLFREIALEKLGA